MPISHQMDIEFKQGEMVINGDKYDKMVTPPSAKQVLLATSEEKEQFRQYRVHQGGVKEYGTSKFQSYIVEADNFGEVQEAYMKIKEANLGASHIVCGYRIYGRDFPFKQDYSDDGEHGAGAVILDELQAHGVFNVAVFVVRYYDGTHIGRERFNIIRELTKDVIAAYPAPLNYGQNFSDQKLVSAVKRIARVQRPQLNRARKATEEPPPEARVSENDIPPMQRMSYSNCS